DDRGVQTASHAAAETAAPATKAASSSARSALAKARTPWGRAIGLRPVAAGCLTLRPIGSFARAVAGRGIACGGVARTGQTRLIDSVAGFGVEAVGDATVRNAEELVTHQGWRGDVAPHHLLPQLVRVGHVAAAAGLHGHDAALPPA